MGVTCQYGGSAGCGSCGVALTLHLFVVEVVETTIRLLLTVAICTGSATLMLVVLLLFSRQRQQYWTHRGGSMLGLVHKLIHIHIRHIAIITIIVIVLVFVVVVIVGRWILTGCSSPVFQLTGSCSGAII